MSEDALAALRREFEASLDGYMAGWERSLREALARPDAPFAVTGPDLSGLGDLLSLTRQEALDAIFDAALDSFDLALPDAAFYSPDQPRVPAGQAGGGRWAGGVSPGTAAARDAASDAVRAFARGQGPPTAREAHALAGHLARLTVAQIHALKAQHGLKGSAPNKAALVAKLAQRFRDARAAAAGAAAPVPPQPFAGNYQQWVAAGRPGLAPAGTPPAAPPAPAPGPPAPALTATTVHGFAISVLKSGQPLGVSTKAVLLNNLGGMSHSQLGSLYSALGGTNGGLLLGTTGNLAAAVRAQLTTPTPPAPPAPAPSPAPAPARVPAFVPGPQGPVPNPVLHRGANVITGTPAAVTTPPAPPGTPDKVWATGKPQPGTLNGIPFATAPPKFWEKVKDVDVKEPPPARPVNRAGVLIREPDGRIWVVQPTNRFGDRDHTLPGGGVEPGLTNQQNALKEVWEETGLQVEITGYAGDFEDSNNGNNGRLYFGRRVGGAPWDAKVEAHIIDRKTGNPAAESETVTLVTPGRAAQLLHRTDDLAQLMAVRPIPVGTPVKGKGSEALKKFVAAIGPAAREYERKRKAAGAKPGNAELHAVQNLRGFNGKPKVVPKADFDSLVAKGDHVEVLRAVGGHGSQSGKQLAEQFRTGEHFPGHGVFGSGTYADSNKGSSNVAAGGSYGGEVMRIALPKSAKVIEQSDLEKAVPTNPAAFKAYWNSGGKAADECWRGVQAALAGYDAIHVDGKSTSQGGYGKGFYVILNRSILTVQDKAPPPGYTIK